MNKYWLVLLIAVGLTSCTDKSEEYYRNNPLELQKALKACPNRESRGLNCKELEQLGNRMNSLAYQLQYNPQGFGHKILALQQTIATQQSELATNNSPELKVSLAQNKQDLAYYLAVVKWLESPES